MDLTEGAGNGTFMSLLVRELIAKTAMIENIFTKFMQIHNGGALFGGPRFVPVKDSNGYIIGVSDTGENKTGVKMGTDGKLLATNVDITGEINATSGTFRGTVYASSGDFTGTIHATDGEFRGSITPSKGMFNSWYWGAATGRTQNDWFQTFKDRIPVGKRLSAFGGGAITYPPYFVDGIFCFIDRLDINTIELNLYPIFFNVSNTDRLLVVPCRNGNNSLVSMRHYVAW